jgi:hypothetical protein
MNLSYKCLLSWSAFEEMSNLRTSRIIAWNACIDNCMKNPFISQATPREYGEVQESDLRGWSSRRTLFGHLYIPCKTKFV